MTEGQWFYKRRQKKKKKSSTAHRHTAGQESSRGWSFACYSAVAFYVLYNTGKCGGRRRVWGGERREEVGLGALPEGTTDGWKCSVLCANSVCRLGFVLTRKGKNCLKGDTFDWGGFCNLSSRVFRIDSLSTVASR